MKTDIKAQTLTMEGSIEAEKFKSYLKNKLQKHVDITVDTKSTDYSSKSTAVASEKKKESNTDQKEKPKEKASSDTTTTTTTDKTTIVVAEIQSKENNNKNDNVPYFIHYVYAPQLFSDENPNACRVM